MSTEQRARFRPKELAIILSYYDIGVIREIHAFRRGNLLAPKSQVVTDTGTYLLKRRAPGHNDPYRVAMAQEIMHFLHEGGFPVPRLIPTRKDGGLLQAYGAVYELFEFVHGEDFDGSQAATLSAGQTLKQLHARMADFQPSFQIPSRSYHHSDTVRQHLNQVLPSIARHSSVDGQETALKALGDQLAAVYEEAAKQVNQLRDPDAHPVISHGDWHPGNMIFVEGKVAGVFDFDAARYVPSLEDIANGCLQFSLVANGKNPDDWPAAMDAGRARCFLEGYRPLSDWPEADLRTVVALMIEALIAEAVAPIAQTGHFATVHGFRFLQMVLRKVVWLQNQALQELTKSL